MLELVAPGATELQRERGVAAAAAALKRAGISPAHVKEGADAWDRWADSGLTPLFEPRGDEVAAADAWDEAAEAAPMACYRGAVVPIEAELVLLKTNT